MYGYIYITTNLINHKKYIGQRKYGLKEPYYGSGTILKKALKKYGRKNFTKQIICECKNKEELSNKEIHFITLFNATFSDEYYNISSGGEGRTSKHTDETKKKMSLASKGKPKSEEAIKKLYGNTRGSGNKGRTISEESKRRMRLAALNRPPVSEETKLKLSESTKRYWQKIHERTKI